MLKRIEVENFKSLKHLDYSCAKLNLLVGLNGAGKSSFIQFLLFLRDLSKRSLSATVGLEEGGKELTFAFADALYCYATNKRIKFVVDFCSRAPCGMGILHFADDTFINQYGFKTYSIPFDASIDEDRAILSGYKPQSFRLIKCWENKTIWDAKYVAEIQSTEEWKAWNLFRVKHNLNRAPNPEYEADLYEQYAPLEKACEERDGEIRARINEVEKLKERSFKNVWDGLKFIEAYRLKPRDLHQGMRKTNYDAVDPEGCDIAEFLYNAGGELSLRPGNPMISPLCKDKRKLLDQVNAWLQIVSPGARIKVDKRDVESSERFLQSVAFGNKEFKPQNVGFGISYVLPVLVALLTSVPEDIVIIENPEAHLHPRGQAEMGNLIARAAAYGVQVFVETHSDHVINGIRVAVKKGIVKPGDVNIAFFERKGHDIEAEDGTKHKEYYAEVRNIKVDSKGSLSEYPEDFMDEWNNQLMRLMKPRKK